MCFTDALISEASEPALNGHISPQDGQMGMSTFLGFLKKRFSEVRKNTTNMFAGILFHFGDSNK